MREKTQKNVISTFHNSFYDIVYIQDTYITYDMCKESMNHNELWDRHQDVQIYIPDFITVNV